jgi:2',3'-cyclic-nucleotide 2'-phosphodiesterase / 3'-nucleotidase
VKPLVESEPAVIASVADEHKQTLEYVRRAVGETAAPLHSYFALVADDPSVQIVNICPDLVPRTNAERHRMGGLAAASAAAAAGVL